MDKRLLIVLPICLAIMIGWQILFPPPVPPPRTAETPAGTAPLDPGAPAVPGTAAEPGSAPAAAPLAERAPRRADDVERELVLQTRPGEQGYYRAVFSNRGGTLRELRSGNHFDRARLGPEERADPEHWVRLAGGASSLSMQLCTSSSSRELAGEALGNDLWTMRRLGSEEAPLGVEFELAPGTGVTFTKRFLFVPGEDTLRIELVITNESWPGEPGSAQFVLTPVGWMHADSGDMYYLEPRAIAASRMRGDATPKPVIFPIDPKGGELQGALPAPSPLGYAGVISKYFAVLLRPADEVSQSTMIGARYRRLQDAAWVAEHPDARDEAWRQIVTDVDLQLLLPAQGESRTYAYSLYAGPKDRERLEAASPAYAEVIDHDLEVWFFGHGISALMLYVLRFFHWMTSNWGVAIILLTVLVKLILFPINRRSQTAMSRYQSKMKRLQPRIDELKKKFEKDPSALRQEQAKLMQQEGAFPPLGGCLPMFLQIPVFIGLYRALGVSYDLRQAPFLWVSDLSLPDRLFRLGFDVHLPLIGTLEYLNVLPPIMVALWIWQQKGMPVPADEQAARMQKMMMWMPVMMGVFLYNYAAGLSLYMITQSGIGVFEQKVIRKYWPVDDKELPPKKGWFGKLLEKQQAQMERMQNQQRRPGGGASPARRPKR